MVDLALAHVPEPADAPPAIAPPPAPPWSPGARVGFRYVFAFVALWLVPFPLGVLPHTELVGRPFELAWNALIEWSARLFLHRPVDVQPNGSGDSSAGWLQLALTVALALVAAVVWSIADRRRAEYARLQKWLRVYLRFAVGTIMIGYGLAKIFHSQFPFPSPTKLEQPYGDASPMGLLWTFMGFSGPYNVFTGLAETVPALLLFFRRTAALGALLLVAVLTNVVVLNFCYDVPVKIYSTELLLASLFIAAPRLPALFDLLLRGRAVRAAPSEPLFLRPRLELGARIAGVVFAGFVLIGGIVEFRSTLRANDQSAARLTGLAGSWDVDEFARDGALMPATPDAKSRWKIVGITDYKQSGRILYRQADDFYDRLTFTRNPDTKTLAVDAPTGGAPLSWTYAQPDADHLTLAGDLGGHALVVKLRRHLGTREFRLVTRGFHWINESPYNR